jgi:hypothetical protein
MDAGSKALIDNNVKSYIVLAIHCTLTHVCGRVGSFFVEQMRCLITRRVRYEMRRERVTRPHLRAQAAELAAHG